MGVGDAFSAKYYSTSFLLEADGKRVLIDCPHPIRKILREASNAQIDIDSIEGILLTHLHADHSSGLEGFAYFRKFFVSGEKPLLIAHKEVLEFLWEGSLKATMGYPKKDKQRRLEDFFEVCPIDESDLFKIEPFSIQCRKTIHPIPTTAFKISVGKRTLAYSADTAFNRELIDWLAESDLFIHETNFGSAHTPIEKLLELPSEIRQKMRLVHYPDNYDLEKSQIEPLIQGKWYTVS